MCAWPTVRSPRSPAWSRKSTMPVRASRSRFRSSAVQRPSNWNSVRSRRFDLVFTSPRLRGEVEAVAVRSIAKGSGEGALHRRHRLWLPLIPTLSPSERGEGASKVVGGEGGRQPHLNRTTNPETAGSAGTTGVTHGKESDRIPEASGAGRCGQSVATDRSRAWSARPQHHGILQGVQRADAEGRKEHPDSGGDHDLPRSSVPLRPQAPADVALPQAGRQDPVRIEAAGP